MLNIEAALAGGEHPRDRTVPTLRMFDLPVSCEVVGGGRLASYNGPGMITIDQLETQARAGGGGGAGEGAAAAPAAGAAGPPLLGEPVAPQLLMRSSQHASQPLADLLCSDRHSDCSIQAEVGQVSFPAHKLVLMSAPEYFASAIATGKASRGPAGGACTIGLTAYSGACVRAMLEFVYRGWTLVDPSNLEEVRAGEEHRGHGLLAAQPRWQSALGSRSQGVVQCSLLRAPQSVAPRPCSPLAQQEGALNACSPRPL